MNEDELVVDKQRATNHLGSEVARHQPVRGIGSLGFDSRRLHHSTRPHSCARSWQARYGRGEWCPERGSVATESKGPKTPHAKPARSAEGGRDWRVWPPAPTGVACRAIMDMLII